MFDVKFSIYLQTAGHLKLYKNATLEDDDVDLPCSQFVGLSRHEFFDAILAASQLIPPLSLSTTSTTNKCNNQLYALGDQLVVEYLDPFIYRNTMDIRQHIKGKEMAEWIKHKMRLHNPVLVRLFKKYGSLENVDNIDEDEWCAMAMDLCEAAATHSRNVWSKGGKPKRQNKVCLYLCFFKRR